MVTLWLSLNAIGRLLSMTLIVKVSAVVRVKVNDLAPLSPPTNV